jgi:hypothetical protein
MVETTVVPQRSWNVSWEQGLEEAGVSPHPAPAAHGLLGLSTSRLGGTEPSPFMVLLASQ